MLDVKQRNIYIEYVKHGITAKDLIQQRNHSPIEKVCGKNRYNVSEQ